MVAVRLQAMFQGDDNTATNCCIFLVHSLSAGPELPSGQGWPGGPIAGPATLGGMGGAVGLVGACWWRWPGVPGGCPAVSVRQSV